ncbi:tyrosine-type DNA invertase [Hafnia alvei]|uniref:tyrosine-type DNA invertase n=1 Tax=Hafnia alvei TaxID=569 RepID=UPI0014121FD5|nr:tyrosine-type DNA invertase [Hafnia alvei]QIP58245.1 tyrosine-type recombinase/integrase [Hafnia alvei]
MQKRKYLTPEEVDAILTASLNGSNPERNHCLIIMAFIHGFRVSELLRLRLSDIDLQARRVNVVRIKNSFSTIHPILKSEYRSLREWMEIRKGSPNAIDNDWLFISRSGRPLSRQQFYNIITQISRGTEISVCAHPHMLRHACGYALADKGIDTRLIQDYLGHKNIQHTVRYTASNAGRFEGIWRMGRKKRQQNEPNC